MTIAAIREGLWYQLPQSVLQRYAAGENEARLKFKSNYYKLQFRSIAVGLSAYSLALRSIYLLVVGASALSVLATLVTTVTLFILWNKWGNESWLLAKKAWSAIGSHQLGSEDEALRCIEAGADLFRMKEGKIVIDKVPLFPPQILNKEGVFDILWLAASYGKERVVNKLIDLQVNLNLNKALVIASTVNIAQALIAAGAEVNPLYDHCSLLYRQMEHILYFYDLSKQSHENFIKNKIPVVNFLLDQGARFIDNEQLRKQQFIEKLREISGSTNCTVDLRRSIEEVITKLERL